MSNQPSEAAKVALKDILYMSDTSLEAAALDLDAFAAQAVAAERARCLGIIGYPRVHFPASYPDWLIWLIELDIRNGVEQPKRGE